MRGYTSSATMLACSLFRELQYDWDRERDEQRSRSSSILTTVAADLE